MSAVLREHFDFEFLFQLLFSFDSNSLRSYTGKKYKRTEVAVRGFHIIFTLACLTISRRQLLLERQNSVGALHGHSFVATQLCTSVAHAGPQVPIAKSIRCPEVPILQHPYPGDHETMAAVS